MNQSKVSNDIFQRVEKKYLLSKTKYELLKQNLTTYMAVDDYGLHTICNIYYDTEHYDLIRTSIEKPVYKEKLRLRSYGVPNENDNVFLEIKKKWKGIVYKRRVPMTLAEANRYMSHNIKPSFDSQILKEIDYFIAYYKPLPKVYLAYDRIAMFGKENPDIRVTFDTNIRSRNIDLDLSKGDGGNPLLEAGNVLMEIKVGGAYPLWLVNILSELEIYPMSFSKYGNVYKNSLYLEEKIELIEERNPNLCLQVL